MATDGQIIVAAARWSDDAVYLKDFAVGRTFPVVVKFVKGQYGGFGVPSLPNPGLQSTAMLLSTGPKHKIIAQAVKIKEGRRVVGVGPKIEIPESYPGYFELLSEEGRGMRAIESVGEIARKMPDTGFLVRETIRGMIAKSDGQGGLCSNGFRTVTVGETLLPITEVQLNGHKTRFLQCVDQKTEFVFLAYDQRGKFSILAKEDHISGVHSAKNLLSKRMPLTVRLVHGPPPRGLKSSSHIVQELRLLAVVEEENIFAIPLQKDTGNVVPLPLAAALKLQPARNGDILKSMKEFQRLCEKGTSLVNQVVDKAHVLDVKLPENKVSRGGGGGGANSRYSQIKTGYFLRRSASLDSPSVTYSWTYTSGNENREPTAAGEDYDDIDQIYDYVRGFAPLPKNIKSPFAEPLSPVISPSVPESHPHVDKYKPEPPPIETIPTKKQQASNAKAEKRTRKEAAHNNPSRLDKTNIPSLYVKNANIQRGRVLRQKSSSPMKDQLGKSGSPIVSIRYKSLTNLQQAMEMDGTLDSSHSGGRTSGDSGAGVKLPEKRSRRLSRPLSLTNLVWEICRPQEIQMAQNGRKPSNPYKINTEHNHPARIGTLYL